MQYTNKNAKNSSITLKVIVKKIIPSFIIQYLKRHFGSEIIATRKKKKQIKNDFYQASKHLQASVDITPNQKHLLSKVNLQLNDSDEMYKPNNALHYLTVGLSAIQCIEKALQLSQRQNEIKTILDFPCGNGRVLRFLRAKFPNADISASDIDSNALKFCRDAFKVHTFLSKTNLKELSSSKTYDLIWCGSLFTHIDETASKDLLKFFFEHLAENGLCIFTTHGNRPINWMKNKERNYGISEESCLKLIDDYENIGFAFCDYPRYKGYGISAISPEKMREFARAVGNWEVVLYLEHGWDNHQDVYAFQKKTLLK